MGRGKRYTVLWLIGIIFVISASSVYAEEVAVDENGIEPAYTYTYCSGVLISTRETSTYVDYYYRTCINRDGAEIISGNHIHKRKYKQSNTEQCLCPYSGCL